MKNTDLVGGALAPTQTNVDSARWLWFLARWSLITAVIVFLLVVTFFAGLGFADSDLARGEAYTELMQAVRAPALYRVFTTLDALGWLAIGGSLLTLAGVVRSQTPIRAAFIAACGIGQLTGALGGFLRLSGTSDFAAHYASAAPNQQTFLLQAFLDLTRVIDAHFAAGQLLQGAGFLLAAWGAVTVARVPRWLAFWLAVPGVTSLTLFALGLGGIFLFPLLLVHILVGIIGLHIALAARLWRVLGPEIAAPAVESSSTHREAPI